MLVSNLKCRNKSNDEYTLLLCLTFSFRVRFSLYLNLLKTLHLYVNSQIVEKFFFNFLTRDLFCDSHTDLLVSDFSNPYTGHWTPRLVGRVVSPT